MSLKSLIQKLDQLNEGIMDEPSTKETPTGRIHQAKPGGYGRKDDEDTLGKKIKSSTAPKGRGRPKKNADSETGEVTTWDASALNSVFGGKKPKTLPGKASVKHKIKDDNTEDIDEDLDPEQKKVGQLGPYDKVGKKGAVGKLVGANESVAEAEKNPHTSALGKALYRDLSKEKKASPQQVQRNKERWAKRQAEREQGVTEAGNKPLEKSYFGTGDTRTPRDIKSQMRGASDRFVQSTADKAIGPIHSKVAKMQTKMAKSELRKRSDHDRIATGTNEGVAEGLGKDIKRLATGKNVKSRAGQEIAKSQDASMKGDNKTANKHFKRYDKLDKLANKGVAEGSEKAHGWKIGKMYRGSNEPFEVVYVDATDEKTALAKAHHSLKPNHMQILTVLRKPQGVAEGSTNKDMTGQTCEKCKKGKYQERSQHDDMQGKVTCKCGHRVDRWKKYKEQGIEEGIGDTIKRGVKSVKRGMAGWGSPHADAPGEIVKRNKGYDDKTVQRLNLRGKIYKDVDGAPDPHSPQGLQNRVLDREMKKRGLGEEGVAEGSGDVVHIHQHQHGTDMGKYGTFNIERETPTIIVVHDHNTGEMLKFNRATGRGIGPASQLMIKQGVSEGFSDVVKGIKRKVAGKQDPKEVQYQHGFRARQAIDASRKYNNQAAYDNEDKMVDRYNKVHKVVNKGVSEGPDQIDELSKETMGSYIKKASKDIEGKKQTQSFGRRMAMQFSGPRGEEARQQKKIDKRHSGISTAVDKLTKEQGVAEGLAPGQAAWKKEMTAKGAVSFKRDQHGGGAVDRIVAYDKDGKVVGGFNRKGVAEGYRYGKAPWVKVIVRTDYDYDPEQVRKLPLEYRAQGWGNDGQGQLIAFASKKDAAYFILKVGGEVVKTFANSLNDRLGRQESVDQVVAEGLSKRDQKDVDAIKAAIAGLQDKLKQPNADKEKIQQTIAQEKKRLALYGKDLAEGMTKRAMQDDAERMELAQFLDRYAHNKDDIEWMTEFWQSTNGEEAVLEGEKVKTKSGTIHKGTYGYGDEKDEKAAPKGRGRPKKDTTADGEGGPKFNDAAKSFFGVGKIAYKDLPGKPGKKHKLKDWIEHIESNIITEAALDPSQVAIASVKAPGSTTPTANTMSSTTTQPVSHTGTMATSASTAKPSMGATVLDFKNPNDPLKAAIQQAVKNKQVTALGEEDVDEVITKATPAGEIIGDFQKSKNSKFTGKSKEERKRMALGAYYGMHPEKSKKEESVMESIDEGHMSEKLKDLLDNYPYEHNNAQQGWGLHENFYQALCDHYWKEGKIPRDIMYGAPERLREFVEECYGSDTGILNENPLLSMAAGAAGTAIGSAVADKMLGDSVQDPLARFGDEDPEMPPLSPADADYSKPTHEIPAFVRKSWEKGVTPTLPEDANLMDEINQMEEDYMSESKKAAGVKDAQMESWDKQLSAMLAEGLTITTTTDNDGHDGASVNATDADAQTLIQLLQNSGLMKGQNSSMNTQSADTGNTTVTVEPVSADEVMGTLQPEVSGSEEGDDALGFLKRMLGAREEHSGTDTTDDSEQGDYEEEDDEACDTCGHEECQCDHEESEEESEEEVEEGNAFSGAVAKAKADGIQKGETVTVGGKKYPVKEDDTDEDKQEVEEGLGDDFERMLAGMKNKDGSPKYPNAKLRTGPQEDKPVSDSPRTAPTARPATKTSDPYSEYSDDYGVYKQGRREQGLDESAKLDEWANSVNDSDEKFLADMTFMTKTISGGLNNIKQDQTVVPSARVKTQGETKQPDLTMAEMIRKLTNIN